MTLKTRITIAAVTAILLVASSLLVLGRLTENAVEKRFQDISITSKSALWQKIISSELNHMESNTISIARDRNTLKALKAADAALLAENANSTYNLLSTGGILSKLQIADLEGRIMYSAPDNFKGKTRKYLPIKALKQGKIMRGIERDDDGKLYTNLAFPVYVRGKPVGVVIYMRDLQSAIEDFKLNDNSDTFILSADGSSEYTTNENLFEQLDLTLPALGSQSMTTVTIENKVYSVAIRPVLDVDGKALAHIVSTRDETESYHAQQAFAFYSYLSIFISLLISVGGLTWYLRKNFKPLNTVVEVMNRISHGDLTDQVETLNRMDEIGQLMQAMSNMTSNLRRIVGDVYAAAGTIDHSTQELSTSNMDMSRRTVEQASSLEETAASMEEMTVTVKQNAASAQQASDEANTARIEAEKGAQVVTRTVQAMKEINASSSRIADIITTIDAIAFQTNLLALNAAVEAAHAGEQGRGFAVVASEVRTLAQRSADAAKEIKGLIEDSVDKVKTGTELVDESGQTLMGIVDSIKNVAVLVAEINAANSEQSAGIDQVNIAVSRMDNMTQHNAALVEESAATSCSMQDQSASLIKLMGFFKLGQFRIHDPKLKHVVLSDIAGQSAFVANEQANEPGQRAIATTVRA